MTDKDKIKKDIKVEKWINDLKVKRNNGVMTPEVIKMCSDCLDVACDWVISNVKLTQENIDGIHAAAEALKKEPEWLAKTTQFIDVYEEVLVWNKMIEKKVISASATVSHREYDIALFKTIYDRYRESHTPSICRVIYNYAHRNDNK